MTNKLQLTWPGKHNGYAIIRDETTGDPKQVPYSEVQPRLLIEIERYGCPEPGNENMLIQGENLHALETLIKSGYTNRIKLVYIDPPFNTGQAFEHYDDGLEHSLWLSMMKDRLYRLKQLLREDGVIFVHIDNNEVGYLRVLMDEVFLRRNFVQMISIKRASPAGFKTINPGPLTVTDYILMYSKTGLSLVTLKSSFN